MKLARLAMCPREFFGAHGNSLGWAWPLLGFYLFALALYFQNYLVPGYHVPFYLVIFVFSWFPTLMIAGILFALLVLFWCWPASLVLAEGQDIGESTKVAGMALLVPAIPFGVGLLGLAILNSNDVALPYRAIVVALQAVAGLWALYLVVVGAKVTNGLNARRTALFLGWFVVLVVALVAIVAVLR